MKSHVSGIWSRFATLFANFLRLSTLISRSESNAAVDSPRSLRDARRCCGLLARGGSPSEPKGNFLWRHCFCVHLYSSSLSSKLIPDFVAAATTTRRRTHSSFCQHPSSGSNMYLITYRVPWKGTVPQRVRIPPGKLSLQPVAIGADDGGNDIVRSTSVERVALGDPATMRAATRVNAEQASKPGMREPTRRYVGEGCHWPGSERQAHRLVPPGYWRAARMEEGDGSNTGSPVGGVARTNRNPVRGRLGRSGWRRGPYD